MSIVHGTLDRRQELLEALNLTENPFVKTEPDEAVLDRIFVGRVAEMRSAAMSIVDHPRNLLVWGGYGCGKTTFVRKLLYELQTARRVSFLTGYTALVDDTPRGFQQAALTALCKGARLVTSSEALRTFATDTLEALTSGDEAGAIDLRFRRALDLAKTAGFHRVVLVIDEIDKCDGHIVQRMLLSSRFLLDLRASFVLTGHPLDAFSDARASLLAVFDHRIELKPFMNAESREILRKKLAVARKTHEPEETLRPFEDDAMTEMVSRARGLPRPLNLMASAALKVALDDAAQTGTTLASVTSAHLSRAIEREGNIIYNNVSAEGRTLLGRIFLWRGYVSGPDLAALAPGELPSTLRELNDLSERDAVLRFEASDGAAFALSPPVEQNLRIASGKRDRLRALWQGALEATDAAAKGKALEAFAAAFFGEAFAVVEKNLRTDTEELDLVLERSPATDPRFTEGHYLIVECKNWHAAPVDQDAVSALYTKLSLKKLKQGFLLATSRFTQPAAQQARNALSQDVEIVLLDGSTIRGFLDDDLRPVGDLLVELHRRQILRAR